MPVGQWFVLLSVHTCACVRVCVCVGVRQRETVFTHPSSGLSVCVGECIFGSEFKLSCLVLLDNA